MSILIHKGDAINNFGKFLPVPYIEKILIHDRGGYEVHFALFLNVDDDEDVEAVHREIVSKLKYYTLLVFNKPTDDLLSRDRNVFGYYYEASATDSETQRTKLDYLNFGLDAELTDDFYDIEGNRVLKFSTCYGCEGTEGTFVEEIGTGGVGEGVEGGAGSRHAIMASATTGAGLEHAEFGQSVLNDEETFLRDPAGAIDQPPGYVTEDDDDEDESAPVEDQEEEMMAPDSDLPTDQPESEVIADEEPPKYWGEIVCDFRVFAFSSTYDYFEESDALPGKLNHKALFDREISDIAYEPVFINCNLVPQLEVHYFDQDEALYSDVPLRSIGGKFYKTECITHDDITDYFNDLLSQYKAGFPVCEKTGTSLGKIKANIAHILGRYKDDVDLLVNLNKLRKVFPSKCGVDDVGRLYTHYKKRVFAMNKALQSNPQVFRRVIRNPKIFDERTRTNTLEIGTTYDRQWETQHDKYLYDKNYVGRMALWSLPDILEGEGWSDEMLEEFAATHQVSEEQQYGTELGDFGFSIYLTESDLEAFYAVDPTGDTDKDVALALYEVGDAIVRDHGYFFFDYERALKKVADINQIVSVDKIEDYGIGFPYSHFRVEKASVSRNTQFFDFDSPLLLTMIEANFDEATPLTTAVEAINYTAEPNYIIPSPGYFTTTELEELGDEYHDLWVGMTEEFIDRTIITAEAHTHLIHRNFIPIESEGAWDPNYRLMAFEFQDFMDDDFAEYHVATEQRWYETKVKIIDKSIDVLKELIEDYSAAHRDLIKYNNLAFGDNPLSYDIVTGMFNNYFITGIESMFPDLVEAPWNRAPLLYNLFRDMLYNTFEGDIGAILDDTRKLILDINPQNGSYYAAVHLEQAMRELYEDNLIPAVSEVGSQLATLYAVSENEKEFDGIVEYDSAGSDLEDNIYGVLVWEP